MSNKIVKGTLILTGAAFISKFLGMIYVIPFNEFVGSQGGALYYYAYNPYTVLISLSTVGIPLAVSKIVSKYNSLGQVQISLKVFRISMLFLLCTGFLAFLILYGSSGWLAKRIIYSDTYGNTVEDVQTVIKMVSFALIIIPAMSVVRGFFQGNQSMEPTAVSQVVEQIVRIIFVLGSAFIIIKIYDGTVTLAVSFATFAAFIGAISSCFVLFYFWKKYAKEMMGRVKRSRKQIYVSTKELTLELFSYAGPFILVGIAIPLYQLVDSFTFNRAMIVAGYGEIAELSIATINLYGHKLISIPITIATGLSLTIVPALTESFTKQNRAKLVKEINQSLQIVLLLVIPAVVGLSTLAFEAYGSLYGMENLHITGDLLMWYAPIALLFSLYTVTAAILQGINEQRYALVSLSVGFIVKLCLNAFLIHQFAGKGSILATGLAVTFAVIINLWRIKRGIQFSFMQTFKRFIFMVIFSFIMAIVIIGVKYVFYIFFPAMESRFIATVMLLVGVMIGAIVYLLLAYKSTLLDFVLEGTNILERFRRKRRANR